MEINIPGIGLIDIKNLLLDYNGTIACDGILVPSVKERIKAIDEKGINVHLLTADSNGRMFCKIISQSRHSLQNNRRRS